MTDQPEQPSPYLQGPATGPGTPGPPAPYDPTRYAAPSAGFDGPWGPLADWGTRVGAYLIDVAVQLVAIIPYVVGFVLIFSGAGSGYDAETGLYAPSSTNHGLLVTGIVLVAVGVLGLIAIQLWNRVFKQGRTGQSVGKKAMGIKLVDERTGQPVGAGLAFVRDLCHALDGVAYIGYLWPLWDDKRQTFADKIMGTVVVRVPKT